MKIIHVDLEERSYDIVIGRNLLTQIPAYVQRVCPQAQQALLLSDETVSSLYRTPFEETGYVPLVVPAGEGSKSMETLAQVYHNLTEHGFVRSDCLIAFGGGVIGDLTGFAAASYMRGVDFIQIPTTLLAMVDSSVGGKTGINLPAGKNLVGAFWQPKLVLVDINLLDTLSDRDFFSGMGEVIKYAYLAERGLHDILTHCQGNRRALMERMEEIIAICCQIKADFVAADERDSGARMLLNLGHTLGHAYEKLGNFQKYTHGEAISAGMVMAARLSQCNGLCDAALVEDVRSLIAMHHLPTAIPALREDYAEAVLLDKKSVGSAINFIFLLRIGQSQREKLSANALLEQIDALKPEALTMRITPARLSGRITPPGSKSMGHRLLIGSLLSGGGSVENLTDSQDIVATRRCMEAMVAFHRGETDAPTYDCGESGSTLRFLIPISLALCGEGRFTGAARLMERPLDSYFEIFEQKGIFYELRDGILSVRGRLDAGIYELAGNVSSQFITGLLYALPLLAGDSEIMLTTALESKGYVDMTLQALAQFGIAVTETERGYQIPGGQSYQQADCVVEPDYSQSGFFYAARSLGNDVTVEHMLEDSAQGDRVILDYVNQLAQTGDVVLDVSDCPDLVPPLAAIAALRAGERTVLANAARLRIKESDRLATTTSELCKLGANIEELPDSLVIHGVSSLKGGYVQSHNDHRIAMMLAMAATRCTEPVILDGAEAVNKSYPAFWRDYVNLGGVTYP